MTIAPHAACRCLAFLSLSALIGAAHAGTLYVDPNGNDSNTGRSLAEPLRTLQAAVDHVQPGDTIELRAGVYHDAIIRKPGRENAWIRLRPHHGEKAVIEGQGRGPALYFYHRSCDEDENDAGLPCQAMYWIVEGLEVRGSPAGGGDGNSIKIDTPKVKIIDNNLCCSSADVIKLVHSADDVEILRNEIHHPRARPGANAQGVDIVGADRTRVAHNYVHDIPSIGMYAKGNARNTVFENNRVENTYSHGIMLGQSTDAHRLRDGKYESYDGIIRNNIVRHTSWSCLATASSFNVRMLNNSCYDTGTEIHGAVLISNESEVKQPGTIIEIRNNIFYGSARQPLIKITSNALTDPATLRVDHNLYWTDTGAAGVAFTWRDLGLERVPFERWRKATQLDSHSRVVDPKIIAPDALRLGAQSPAIDAGVDSELVTTDYAGTSRPQNSKTDIGAYEFIPTNSR